MSSKHTNNQGNKSSPDEAQAPESTQEVQPDTPETDAGQEGLDEALKGAAAAMTPEAKIAELEAKVTELNDQLLRKAADFDNYRKRTMREKQEVADFANQGLLLDLLPVIDDFDRAIKSGETSNDFASFYEGVLMIEKRLLSQLENKWGLKRFDSAGEPFDPNRHEALQMEKAKGISEPVVKEEYEKGYLLKDRVIRFARVKVLMPDEEAPVAE